MRSQGPRVCATPSRCLEGLLGRALSELTWFQLLLPHGLLHAFHANGLLDAFYAHGLLVAFNELTRARGKEESAKQKPSCVAECVTIFTGSGAGEWQ